MLPPYFIESTKGLGFFVSWEPESKVLSNPFFGGFLSHSGWKSTIERICKGFPMIFSPFFLEQQSNRRFVDNVWKVGLEMSEEVSRENVETLVRKLMNVEDEQVKMIRKNILKLKESAILAGQIGKSSYNNIFKFANQMLHENV